MSKNLRQISLLAVLLLVMAGLLAACGDSTTATTAPAVTSAAAATTSAAATTAAPAATTTAASTTTTTAAATTPAGGTTTATATTPAAATTTASTGTTTTATGTTAAPGTTAATGGATALVACDKPSAAATGGKTFKVGIAVQNSIPALDNAIAGVKKGLADCGFVEGKNVTYSLGNALGDLPALKTIGDKFRDEKVDLIVAVGTQALTNMYTTNPDKPIVFNAVTDPYVALKDVIKSPTDHANITGVQANPPIEETLKLIKEILPNAKNVGLVWTTNEVNSKNTTDRAKQVGPTLGLTIQEAAISKGDEVLGAAQSLADKVDVFFSTTDVNVVANLEALFQVAAQSKKPIISVDPASVPRGAALALGISYFNNGLASAKLMNQILNGTDVKTIPIEKEANFDLQINAKAAELTGLTIPDAVKSRASKTLTEITPKQ